LESYEALFERTDCQENADLLQAFCEAFISHENKRVTTAINQITQHWQETGRAAGHPGLLREIIEGIADVHDAVGPEGAASDFRNLLTLFEGDEDVNIANFTGDMMAAMNALKR
jgi:excinuclease UvrABC nuclease subunit